MNVNLANTDRRCWRYRPGESGATEKKIFDSPELVPPLEGWVDTPEKFPGRSRHAEHEAELAALKEQAKSDEAALSERKRERDADRAELARLEAKQAKAGKPAKGRAAPGDGAL